MWLGKLDDALLAGKVEDDGVWRNGRGEIIKVGVGAKFVARSREKLTYRQYCQF